jgi:hypothetical protein
VIYMMDFLINVCLIFAVWRIQASIKGEMRKARDELFVEAKVTEKLSSRAFNLANSATLGVVALQKALAVPRVLTKEQGELNAVAKEEVDELFKVGGTMEWMKPLMSEDELDAYEKAQALAEAEKLNGKPIMDRTN